MSLSFVFLITFASFPSYPAFNSVLLLLPLFLLESFFLWRQRQEKSKRGWSIFYSNITVDFSCLHRLWVISFSFSFFILLPAVLLLKFSVSFHLLLDSLMWAPLFLGFTRILNCFRSPLIAMPLNCQAGCVFSYRALSCTNSSEGSTTSSLTRRMRREENYSMVAGTKNASLL